jgi:hypothetical protein
VPVEGEEALAPDAYGSDRVFVFLRVSADSNLKTDRRVAALEKAGLPVARIEMPDRYGLGGEFLRWELATAAAAAVMGVNPFDEPNVAESKNNTRLLLAEWIEKGSLAEGEPVLQEDGVSVYADSAAAWLPQVRPDGLRAFLSDYLALRRPGDYAALLAYVAAIPEGIASSSRFTWLRPPANRHDARLRSKIPALDRAPKEAGQRFFIITATPAGSVDPRREIQRRHSATGSGAGRLPFVEQPGAPGGQNPPRQGNRGGSEKADRSSGHEISKLARSARQL